jgi:hypothetical protein
MEARGGIVNGPESAFNVRVPSLSEQIQAVFAGPTLIQRWDAGEIFQITTRQSYGEIYTSPVLTEEFKEIVDLEEAKQLISARQLSCRLEMKSGMISGANPNHPSVKVAT